MTRAERDSEDSITCGKESVWDYPRPPRVDASSHRAIVVVSGARIAESTAVVRVLETSHPPTIYFPPNDVMQECLRPAPQRSVCEFKGQARYWDIVVDERVVPQAAWSYPAPAPGYEAIQDFISFFPNRVDACYLAGELVQAQEGDFYGGWITSEIVGPFKGPAGTRHW